MFLLEGGGGGGEGGNCSIIDFLLPIIRIQLEENKEKNRQQESPSGEGRKEDRESRYDKEEPKMNVRITEYEGSG